MNTQTNMETAIAWCLAWGQDRTPYFSRDILDRMLAAFRKDEAFPEETSQLIEQVRHLQGIPSEYCPESISELATHYPELWDQTTSIGLVYGGATKIKGYVFESAKLPEIRGASALLDRINLTDLTAFFNKQPPTEILSWLDSAFPGLQEALIPESIVYSTGGNILAFCPAAFVETLADAIERRYTEETLTANSCAVGDTFHPLEIRFGLLSSSLEATPWLDWYRQNYTHPLVEAYFGRLHSEADLERAFKNRKSFNELVGELASQFNYRRNGNDTSTRPSRRYPPMLETHPYLVRDRNDRASAVGQADRLPDRPWFSDALARKYLVGQKAKRQSESGQQWYYQGTFNESNWKTGRLDSWVWRFEQFLDQQQLQPKYYQQIPSRRVSEAQTLEEIGNSSNSFVAFIYADGNNVGGYIQQIRTPEQYQTFSKDLFEATEQAVYHALAQHLQPQQLGGLQDPETQREREEEWIHPFEIVTIGGDDVLLIVPANRALEIARTIGEKFEAILSQYERYCTTPTSSSTECHRYRPEHASHHACRLSLSSGVLLLSHNTPIYYAENLAQQLLKSAKKQAQHLKQDRGYQGGTVDWLALKSVTMVSSDISRFRESGMLARHPNGQTLKLYGGPYTLHELGGLLETARALKESGFPRSQLYQLRDLLAQGKKTAMLNYRYFRARLDAKTQQLLLNYFERAWCEARTNDGNLAPWTPTKQASTYETIWRDLVDLYNFVELESPIGQAVTLQGEGESPA